MDDDIQSRVEDFIKGQNQIRQRSFVVCGASGDGKSSLLARLLLESDAITDDRKSAVLSSDADLVQLVDGLSSERQQGMTVDAGYHYFSTDHAKFVAVDVPGREQYTSNMVSGASTADIAVIVVDVNQGMSAQTRRHAFMASLLGIRYAVLAVNKMDEVDFDQAAYVELVDGFQSFSDNLSFESITAIPVSALRGDNVISRSQYTNWHAGPTLLGYLETVEVHDPRNETAFRLPVQAAGASADNCSVCRGTVVAGSIETGDQLRVLPSGEIACVTEISLYRTKLETARNGQAVCVHLDRDLEIARGDVLTRSDAPCEVSDQFEVSMIWMDRAPGYVGRSYLMKIGASQVNATITDIKYKYNINTFEHLSSRAIEANEIAELTLNLDRPVPFETFENCKALGGLVLIDRYSHATVGAGMINFSLRRAQNVHRQALVVDRKARAELNGHTGKVLWFTGLSGSGKSTIANALEQVLHKRGIRTYILDGDNVRHGLNKDLGFTDADRIENIRRISEVAKLMVDAGIVVLTAFISPFRSERDMARSLFEPGEFVEIYIDVPLETAEQRDPKGLYKKARRGELPNFTGIDSAYEAPQRPEVSVDSGRLSVDECVEKILDGIE